MRRTVVHTVDVMRYLKLIFWTSESQAAENTKPTVGSKLAEEHEEEVREEKHI